MKFNLTLVALLTIFSIPLVYAMDQTPQFDTISDETLVHILLMLEQDQQNLGRHVAILRQVCKRFENLLSAKEIQYLTKLTQSEINEALKEFLKAYHFDINAVQIFLLFGAQFNRDTILEEILVNAWVTCKYPHPRQPANTFNESHLLAIITLLIKHGAVINPTNRPFLFTFPENLGDYTLALNSPLNIAIHNEWQTVVKHLLENGALLNEYSLNIAVSRNNPRITKLLLDHGANPNIPEGPSIIFVSSAQVTGLLLDAQADLYMPSGQNQIVLIELIKRALFRCKPSILIELLKKRYPVETALATASLLNFAIDTAPTACTIL